MALSPNLGLHLVPQHTTKTVQEWRLEENGTGEDSNMMILDKAVGELQTKKANKVVEFASEPSGLSPGDEWDRIL